MIIEINSFSYKEKIPKDSSEHGGGYLFDMRGILNPGRIEPYKKMTGKDKPVEEFLATKTEMPKYLSLVFQLLNITIQSYLERGFEHMQINFGCTGGQHRSVYAAEKTAAYIKDNFPVEVRLNHTNANNWNI